MSRPLRVPDERRNKVKVSCAKLPKNGGHSSVVVGLFITMRYFDNKCLCDGVDGYCHCLSCVMMVFTGSRSRALCSLCCVVCKRIITSIYCILYGCVTQSYFVYYMANEPPNNNARGFCPGTHTHQLCSDVVQFVATDALVHEYANRDSPSLQKHIAYVCVCTVSASKSWHI